MALRGPAGLTRPRSPARVVLDAPYARTLGLERASVTARRVRLRLPYRESNANRTGTLHGGVLASLIVVAGELGAWAAAGGVGDGHTADLAVHYLAPASREAVVADAEVVRRGREIVFVAVEVTTARGAAVARGLVAYRLRPPEPLAPAAAPDPIGAPRGWRSGSPFTRQLGVQSALLASGESIAVLPAQPGIADRAGRVHEGALATLVDSAGGNAAWSVAGLDRRRRAATLAMHLAFAATAPSTEEVVALARAPRDARTIFVNAVTVAALASGRVLASGTVTYQIARPR